MMPLYTKLRLQTCPALLRFSAKYQRGSMVVGGVLIRDLTRL